MFDAFIPNASVVSTIFRSFQSVLFYLSTFHSIRVTCGPKCLLSFNPCYILHSFGSVLGRKGIAYYALSLKCTDTMDFQLSPSTVGRSQGSRSLHPPYSSFLKFCPWHPNMLHFNIFSLSVRGLSPCTVARLTFCPLLCYFAARPTLKVNPPTPFVTRWTVM
ncbi:uncharacterized protein F5891DRAFT_1181789 [Suillus fuscotomentosus]|uniref:Uncharacterized protein n=1 Tax=Suillus fuscotomentosus TaxID=1912939 RepID=A0AAD4HT25_9AGAM|nr:uncharacterized protein F5891DRAFT_1181789 [Suillus fuscotomentosus]KAG1907511.1 hypothetical protein F5891DRAFT_1181789 [Suillus fuscotomentosus]